MKKSNKRALVDLSQIKINPDIKSCRDSPFVVRKVEAAKKALENVDLSILNLPHKA
ncbi:hypothetical protein [Dyadobacter sp. CY343]|uniref:hypothetical protein n=1 Tax=Dyadobacter sp. CY343 TaxID=2907299 RepID=UPI001F1D8727|nr:hypothetical protein [Dyadobacter sp. CY343]MCE7063560.1 hypothetical protein [Dyadobacter sp. CY343]